VPWLLTLGQDEIIQSRLQGLAAPASEAICRRVFDSEWAKHIGTSDRVMMARLFDEETFEMLVLTQYNLARHGGVEAIEVSMISFSFL
jgi:hypothetical protein